MIRFLFQKAQGSYDGESVERGRRPGRTVKQFLGEKRPSPDTGRGGWHGEKWVSRIDRTRRPPGQDSVPGDRTYDW